MMELTGLIAAQANLKLASQTQHIANLRESEGRILVRQGLTDGNEDKVEKGEALQAESKEIMTGVFEHINNAIKDVSTVVEERNETAQDDETDDENGVKTPSGTFKNTAGELDVVVDDNISITVKGGKTTSLPAYKSNSKINVTV
jgi:hypothetical protein